MEGFLPLLTALGLVFVLELGDKTQLVTVSLAAQHGWKRVLAGASLGLVAITGLAAAMGGLLAEVLVTWLWAVQAAGGVLFVAVGVASLVRGEGEVRLWEGRGPFTQSLGFVLVAEMGDKTQLTVVLLAATYAAPFSVFVGGSLALVAVAVLSVALGGLLGRALPTVWIRRVAALLFVAVGIYLLFEALV